MRILTLTSSDIVRGATTDDGFRIGEVTLGGTLGLVALGTFAGVLAAVGWLVVRHWLPGPRSARLAQAAIGAGSTVGALLVHTSGIDFRILSPVWLAVALFVAVPALAGLLVAVLTERFERPGGWFAERPLPLALLPLLVWAMPLLLLFVGLPLVVLRAAWERLRRVDGVRQTVDARAFRTAVWMLLVGVAAVGAVDLVRDVAELT